MPIVTEPRSGPLRQGDILKDVLMYVTLEDTGAGPQDAEHCVVLSRDCKAFRAATVLVAPVVSYSGPVADALSAGVTLDEARRIMCALRDGDSRPDEVYIGPLETDGKRACVDISQVHTIQIPMAPKHRTEWIQRHRVKSLDEDFVRHVQVRLLASIQRQGFDDFSWWPVDDLKIIVHVGQREVAKLEAERLEMEAELKSAELKGEQKNKNFPKQVAAKAKEVSEAKEELELYELELGKRSLDS